MTAHVVLVARLDNDGDVLLAGPAIRAVAASGARVVLLHGPRGRQAAALLPGVAERIEFLAPWIDPDAPPVEAAALDALVAAVRAAGVDTAAILTSFHQNALPLALLLRLAGVGRIAAISEDYPGALLDVRHRVDETTDPHEAERALALVGTLGFALPPGDDGALRVDIGSAAPPPLAPPYVVVHPGASVPARAWEPAHLRALVAALAARGRRVVVTGAPSERALTAFVAGDDARDLGGATSFAGLGAVLRDAACVVVGNTGPAHLAAAVGTPVVSLFAPTVPAARWRPYRVACELLFVDVPCAGCRARVCPVEGHPCLAGITVEDVVAAVERLGRTRLGSEHPQLEPDARRATPVDAPA